MSNYSPRGSLWHKWDLHLHTPASYDYQNRGVTNEQIVDLLLKSGVRVVAITDHHVIDVGRIQELQTLAGDKITILPGVELRSDQGGEPIHYICIFPEDCDLPHVWTTLQGSLGLTKKSVEEKGGDDKVYVPIEQAAAETRKLGGVVSIHAGKKSNSIEGIKNQEQFQQKIKYDITEKWVDLMEIGQIKDIDVHLKTIFPLTGLRKPLLICSDNHDIANYGVKSGLWFRADPTFRGLLMIIREPQDRVYIGNRPDELVRIEQNPTKFAERIEFIKRTEAPASEQWFNGSIEFNPGLIAIVGNKGSGKSALADTLGLLGASRNAHAFSFLSDKRFRKARGGFAQFFDATLTWESGETVTRRLSDVAPATEVERLKYLPQDHVETVCNELAGTEETGFEKELKSVIFSHVPDPQQLGQSSLDDLVRFQTNEKQKRIDVLIRQLKELSRQRAALEVQANPETKREIEEKIKQRALEIEAHDRAKPPEKTDPKGQIGSTPPSPELLDALAAAENEKKALELLIAKATETLRLAERRNAVTRRLIERIDNFAKEFIVFQTGLEEDAGELGLKVADLATLTLNKKGVESLRDSTATEIQNATRALSPTDSEGLKNRLGSSRQKLIEIQSKLDAPNREYQAYLKEVAEWQAKRIKLEGNENDGESLKGLQHVLTLSDALPTLIAATKSEQLSLSKEIHVQKLAQAEVYRSLYQPVQQFIDTHALAKDKLKLEFRAELTNENFATRFLNLLALNRKGSFMGVDEGRAAVEKLLEMVKWDDAESSNWFLGEIDDALHEDRREQPPAKIQLRDQLPKGTKAEDIFDFIYSLEYIQPRYILRWDGKDLTMLSPGERGTLLLVFYLLIDKGDMPLVIDQPEGNLDNHTVAMVLVDCIREARTRRQIFIVTHNPNLAVVCDADQVIYANIDKSKGNAITYTSGSLENPMMSKYITDVLEGTRWAFDVRDEKYKVGE